jgi:response regulator RpfG family c-di-GMP phosphodiesterase
MLTAMKLEKEEQQEFLKLKAQEFLSKPISIEELKRKIKKILKK